MSLFDLSGDVVIVTGGGGLLGEPICQALSDHGAAVIVADVDREQGEAVAAEVQGVFRLVDITDSDSVAKFCDGIVESHGGIDGLVNTAYPRTEDYGGPFESVDLEQWQANVNLHLGGYYNITRAVALRMIESDNGGSIVNFGSIYGVQAPDFGMYEGSTLTSPVEYAAIKSGILNLTRYLASYLGEDGIRVNTVSPGGVFNDQDDRFVGNYEENTPLSRMAEPEDIPGAVVYLLSDAASYVTGHNLVVDGGWTIK